MELISFVSSSRASPDGLITSGATELTFGSIKVGTTSSQFIPLKNSSDTEQKVIIIILTAAESEPFQLAWLCHSFTFQVIVVSNKSSSVLIYFPTDGLIVAVAACAHCRYVIVTAWKTDADAIVIDVTVWLLGFVLIDNAAVAATISIVANSNDVLFGV